MRRQITFPAAWHHHPLTDSYKTGTCANNLPKVLPDIGTAGTRIRDLCGLSRGKNAKATVTTYRPGGGETICPPSMAVRLAADLRLSADGSAVRTSLVAGQLQAAACVRITYRQLRHGASVLIAYRLGQTNGRIAVSFNAPPPTATGHNNI